MQFNGLEASLLLIAGFAVLSVVLTGLLWLMYYGLSRLGVGVDQEEPPPEHGSDPSVRG